MRAFLNGILSFIGAESLTDQEWSTITITEQVYTQETYDVLAEILQAREAISTLQDKLVAYFLCKGLNVVVNDVATSNIYVGDVLEW